MGLVIRKITYPDLDATPRVPPRDPVHGAVSPLAQWQRSVPRPRGEVIAGFRTQEVRMQIEGRLVVFTAADRGDPFPFQHPVLLLGATGTAKAQHPAVALAHDRQWVEPLHVVRDDDKGWEAASALGGRFLVRWSEDGAELVDLVSRAVVDRWQMQGRTVRHRCCPLIPDARPGDMCRLHGGPWVSMSILAAANWHDRRALFLDMVGCDEPCGNRRPHGDRVPTRYTTWLSEAEFSQPEMHNDGHCRICMRVDCGHVGSVAVVDPPLGATVVRQAEGGQWLQWIAEPLVLSRGRIVEVGCAPRGVRFVLNRMILDDAGGSEQLLDWAHASPAWPAMDADLAHRFRGLDFVHRWVCIGRFRVTGVRLGDATVPVAFDLRQPRVLTSRVIARLGALMLGEVRGWRLGHVQMLHGGNARVDRATGSDVGALAEWLLEERLAHLAAMFMEPLDPEGGLTLLERQRYYDALIAVLGSASLGVDADELRRLLAGSQNYLRAQAAMADPRSDQDFWQAVHDHGRQLGTREVFRLGRL